MKKLFILFSLFISTHMFASSFEGIRERLKGHVTGAHQGHLFGLAPNTMEAFEFAAAQGIDVVEMDLRVSKDGVVVVFHDETLNRWTNCKGKVSEKTLRELENCRFTLSHKARIPTFEEVLKWSLGKVVVDAEFKDIQAIPGALELVKKYHSYDWTYFQAQGNREKYELAHSLDPKVALLYAIKDQGDDLAWALAQDEALLIVEVNAKTRSKQTLEAIHKAGKFITEDAWHFSRAFELFGATCGKAFRNGIDIAISNRPIGCARQK